MAGQAAQRPCRASWCRAAECRHERCFHSQTSVSPTVKKVAAKEIEHHAAKKRRGDTRGRSTLVQEEQAASQCPTYHRSALFVSRPNSDEAKVLGTCPAGRPVPARTSRLSCPASAQTRPPAASGRCSSRQTLSSRAAPAAADDKESVVTLSAPRAPGAAMFGRLGNPWLRSTINAVQCPDLWLHTPLSDAAG